MLIQAENITFGYSKRTILHDVSFSIRKGEIVSLLGPNGCGKTTLLKILLGLFRPGNGGKVLFEGREISSINQKMLARSIAYVPQIHRASFAYRVLDVVLMGRMPHKSFFARYNQQDTEMARSALEKLSILHLEDRPYTEISGGERQLTLIARAMTQGAHSFIFDEPANGLDYGNQIKLLEELINLSREGYTFIKSTHFPDHALWVADRVVMLKEGAIIANGRPDDTITSDNLFKLYGREVDVHALEGKFQSLCAEQDKQWQDDSCRHKFTTQMCTMRKGGPVLITDINEVLERCIAYHGHYCTGQSLGVRIAKKGLELVAPEEQKDLIVFVENDRCIADAVLIATGTRLGRRSLKYVDYGRMAATFVNLKKDIAWRVGLKPFDKGDEGKEDSRNGS